MRRLGSLVSSLTSTCSVDLTPWGIIFLICVRKGDVNNIRDLLKLSIVWLHVVTGYGGVLTQVQMLPLIMSLYE